jgi:hypothetical protein
MTKISASILVFLALFAFVSAEQFQRINFDQGKLRLRTLDTASSLKSFTYTNYTNSTAVNVNLGDAYIKKAAIDTTKTQTDMMIILSGSTTGFCSDCTTFVKFQCTDNDCSADQTKPQQTANPFFYIQRGYPFTINVTIGADATSWQLKNTAVLFSSGWSSHSTYSYPGSFSSPYYIQNYTTYGFIGMGIDGDSASNFVGDHPLFSVTTNGAGSGQLIFGKDTSKIDSTRISQTITADTNWTMSVQNISAGPNMTAVSSTTKLILDLNYPGLGLPSNLYTTIFNKMVAQYNLQYNSSTFGNIQFPYLYKGDLANLGSITFGLTNNQNITIPPQAYTRKLADGIYCILLQTAPYLSTNVYTQAGSEWVYYGVIGWSVMSNFYTVFEKTATSEPTITLYPTYSTSTSGNNTTTTTTSSWKTILIIAVVVLVALVVISVAAKKKNSLTKSDLGVELRAARV